MAEASKIYIQLPEMEENRDKIINFIKEKGYNKTSTALTKRRNVKYIKTDVTLLHDL